VLPAVQNHAAGSAKRCGRQYKAVRQAKMSRGNRLPDRLVARTRAMRRLDPHQRRPEARQQQRSGLAPGGGDRGVRERERACPSQWVAAVGVVRASCACATPLCDAVRVRERHVCVHRCVHGSACSKQRGGPTAATLHSSPTDLPSSPPSPSPPSGPGRRPSQAAGRR
jgi:hypothetical protein